MNAVQKGTNSMVDETKLILDFKQSYIQFQFCNYIPHGHAWNYYCLPLLLGTIVFTIHPAAILCLLRTGRVDTRSTDILILGFQ